MDTIDKKIIHAIESNARISYAALAENVGLSKTPCWSRVKALEETGIIRLYRAQLDAELLGFGIEAFVQVSINFDQSDQFEEAAKRHPLVRRCYATTGEADYLLQILSKNMASLDRLLREEICRLPGVTRSVTSMVTREIKADTSLAFAAQTIGEALGT